MWHKKNLNFILLVMFLMLTILAALYFIDLIAAGREWFFPVGLPVTIAVFIAAGTIIMLHKAAHFKGLNIIASAFVIFSLFILDLIISTHFFFFPRLNKYSQKLVAARIFGII